MTHDTNATTTIHRFDQIERMVSDASSRDELFSSQEFVNRFYDQLDKLMNGRRILSLDIFDTLVLRDNSSELTRFLEIGEKMAELVSEHASAAGQGSASSKVRPVDAFYARYLGTKASYRASTPVRGCKEGSLTEIHQTASRLLVGDDDLTHAFISAELDYEVTRLTPNTLIVEYARRHKQRGGNVVLVSDMYMHADQIQLLLEKLGLAPDLFDLLISSADTKVSKASGGIFALVEADLEASPEDFFHLGDSLRGDFKKPRERGWGAMHLPVPTAEILARRKDHLATAKKLKDDFNLQPDIAIPH